MQKIATITVGAGGAATIDFTSIPGNYTDLVLLLSARTTATRAGSGTAATIKLNGVATNQTRRMLYADGATPASFNDTQLAVYVDPSDATANTFGSATIWLPNYAGSGVKSVQIDATNENNTTTADSEILAGLWNSTAAINQITLTPFAGNFAQYSTATLYGVTKGSGGATVS